MFEIAAPAPAETPAFNLDADSLFASIQTFVTDIISLNPEQAALRGGLTLLIVIAAAMLIWGMRVLYKTMLERVAPEKAEGAAKQRALSRWLLRLVRIGVVAAALLAILRLWGLDFEDFSQGPIGAIFGTATRILIILVIAFGVIELAQLGISRMFSRIANRARSPRRASQVRTLAPLLSGVITSVLIVIAAMMALSEIGVEIGPLIAGAGIIGLAVGFGAQTLVKDFLTGIFLILEDIVSVGDVIGIGDFGGVVEEMSLRTIKLRDYDGTLHVFPYSEAQIIHNRTKMFSFAVFNLSVDYQTDVRKAIETMRAVAAEMRADPEFAASILDDIDIAGVDALADSAIMLKARIKTSPGKQWGVQRGYLQRIKAAFDEAGIDIPYPHMKLVAPQSAAD
ncbi:MAG TPA: mechanosensitive ion channel [Terricaulis sp.]|nr:mechanosensitive ion channel [Terricaulis sp.]